MSFYDKSLVISFHAFAGNHLSVRLPYGLPLSLTEKLYTVREIIVIESHAQILSPLLWVSKADNTFQ